MIFLLIFGLLIVIWVIYSLVSNKNTISPLPPKNRPKPDIKFNFTVTEVGDIEKKPNDIKPFNGSYSRMEVQNCGFQLAESLKIISSSKNIDTVKSRFELINNFYGNLIESSKNKKYLWDIQDIIQRYKGIYYDRPLNEMEIILLEKPNMNNLYEYYSGCLVNCFLKFYNEETQKIKELQRQHAIENRMGKIMKMSDNIYSELVEKCGECSNFEENRDILMKIKWEITNKRYGRLG